MLTGTGTNSFLLYLVDNTPSVVSIGSELNSTCLHVHHAWAFCFDFFFMKYVSQIIFTIFICQVAMMGPCSFMKSICQSHASYSRMK